jgi:hypothetical protein
MEMSHQDQLWVVACKASTAALPPSLGAAKCILIGWLDKLQFNFLNFAAF